MIKETKLITDSPLAIEVTQSKKKGIDYFPYLSSEDATVEYNSLRNEILESQKQRVILLQVALGFIGIAFAYLVNGDKIYNATNTCVLIIISSAACFYSYSTRHLERRIASYIGVYLKPLSPWSFKSSSFSTNAKWYEKTSTVIIVSMITLDIALIGVSVPKFSQYDWALYPLSKLGKGLIFFVFETPIVGWICGIAFTYLNLKTYQRINNIKDYRGDLKEDLTELLLENNWEIEEISKRIGEDLQKTQSIIEKVMLKRMNS